MVRRRLSAAEATSTGQRWTDVIGVVVAADDDALVLRRDPARASAPGAGTEVRVARAEIEAVKQLPPRPRRTGRP
ncbi:hypothetical protein GCM10023216_24760 [Isoptericola chiayiensis]|uniref:Uncharacterized protein n=1 Tax=Isoptericola chiayiensis TaxID=579446 RepID=A0ABP8YJ55_9MICO